MTANSLKEQQIYNAQVEIIYEQIPTNLFPAIVITSVLSWTIWSTENSYHLTLWLLANFTSIGLRFFSYLSFKNRKAAENQPLNGWARLAFIQLLAYGILWGLMPILFTDINSNQSINLLAVYFFTTAGMIGLTVSHSSFKPMWFAYVIPAAGSMIALLFFSSYPGTNLMALYLILFVFFLFFMMQRNHKSFREIILLKLEYADLMLSLQREKEKSDIANISKSTFLAAASHDLRQPVHAMNLFIEMLQNKSLPDDASLLIDRIATSAASLQSLFNSLLDISSLDAGTVDVNIKNVNIANYIKDLVALHTPEIEEIGLQIEVDVDNVCVLTDPVLLTRILSNLLSNAINHTGHGKITVSAKEQGQSVVVSVKDTGKGIAAENIANIFDEFKQLHNPERDRNKGLGLGLAICSRLATLLDTKINVTSVPEQGSTFSLTLNLGDINEQYVATHKTATTNILLDQYSILIVDDEKDIREAMPMLLDSWGCQNIRAVSDLHETKETIENGFIPDLIISDFRLRNNISGLEVIDHVSALLGYKVRAILITGDTAPESLLRIREAGLIALHKPIISNQLKEAINHALL
ncbi:hybrid sensor histidine kinase/response regulator [Oceanicoccus sp. KOV_DT_Chl]|uniref:hybrid sensor histidine kinase/response regulator n=1 Tax=Oceanicoccus sp. KOV_DT_Chl TaxID=1904639 RepID=UPI000C7E4CB4|nr:hybrid sensor histidine kinase/response regulator [Oceanicoccus sp. KOV_DT_Chl]